MKRILSIFLACVLLLSCFSFGAFAASKELQYEVSVNGQNEIVVPAGEEITVDLYLNNVTDDGTYTVTNLHNEIEYDKNFFEVAKEDIELIPGKSTSGTLAVYSLGATRVRILGNVVSQSGQVTEFENEQLIARVTFKVKEGLAIGSSSDLVNKVLIADDALSDVTYTISTQNMTVYVGEKPTQTYTITYKNGNDVVRTENKAGTAIIYTALSAADKKFAGWKDETGKIWNPGETYTVTKDMTFTAEWVERYTLSFDTDGGTPVASVEAWGDETIDLSQFTTTKTGFKFVAWYKDSGLTQKVTNIKLTEDTTVYAKWKTIGGGGGGSFAPVTPPEDDKPENYKPDIMTDEHYAYIMGREDGKIYPQANLTRAEAATIFFRLLKEDVRAQYMTRENKFTDVESGAWYNTAVSTLANLGLINGRTATTYAPNAPITRAELTTIVARLSKAEYSGADLGTGAT